MTATFSGRTLLVMSVLISISCRKPPATIVEARSGIRLILIPAGHFDMGSPPTESGHRPDETPHRVVLRQPFYMAATEVTQEQWFRVMGTRPGHFRGDRLPVESITWFEIQEFLQRLNSSGGPRFRLPTEAEWEYACRAGSRTPYSSGATLSATVANFDDRDAASNGGALFRGRTTPVASFPPNAWGLYDMHGNVWEWCTDEYCAYSDSTTADPIQSCGSPFKVLRGGSWYFGADSARSALRYTHEPLLRGFSIGFRVVREFGPAGAR